MPQFSSCGRSLPRTLHTFGFRTMRWLTGIPAWSLRHEDLARQRQAFAELGLLVHLVRHVGAPDKHRLRILLDERVEAEEGLRHARWRAAGRFELVAAPAAAKRAGSNKVTASNHVQPPSIKSN